MNGGRGNVIASGEVSGRTCGQGNGTGTGNAWRSPVRGKGGGSEGRRIRGETVTIFVDDVKLTNWTT